ncbi:hypothetical protein MRM75_06665 [bacterium 19CA06SA08-2]|uniref:Uncharacterized protein n=1 Tax=bacterium 19CA06SA08-2 TaxID=2920658 RepID=A0AAU6U8S1_UNCXX
MFFSDRIIILSFLILVAVAQGVKASESADMSLDGLSHCPAKVCTTTAMLIDASLDELKALDRGGNWLPVLNQSGPSQPKYSQYAPLLVVGAERFEHQISGLLPVLSPEIWL